jgi:hypothetical protein
VVLARWLQVADKQTFYLCACFPSLFNL